MLQHLDQLQHRLRYSQQRPLPTTDHFRSPSQGLGLTSFGLPTYSGRDVLSSIEQKLSANSDVLVVYKRKLELLE